GPEAYRFVDFLAETGQSLWQMLPVGPTGYGNSPYQSLSSFAGNTLLLSLEHLADEELLDPWEERDIPKFSAATAEFEKVTKWNEEQLKFAHGNFLAKRRDTSEFEAFCAASGWWLEDYALFRALKRAHEDKAWTDWSPDVVRRDSQAIEKAGKSLHLEIDREKFLQFQFDRQWRALKTYANERGVKLVGDVPIFAAHDSVDGWEQQE